MLSIEDFRRLFLGFFFFSFFLLAKNSIIINHKDKLARYLFSVVLVKELRCWIKYEIGEAHINSF